MKIRDYLLIGLMIIAVVWIMQPISSDRAANDRPILSGIVKIAKQILYFSLFFDEPPVDDYPPETYMDLPRELANEPPSYAPNADGIVSLRHSEGW